MTTKKDIKFSFIFLGIFTIVCTVVSIWGLITCVSTFKKYNVDDSITYHNVTVVSNGSSYEIRDKKTLSLVDEVYSKPVVKDNSVKLYKSSVNNQYVLASKSDYQKSMLMSIVLFGVMVLVTYIAMFVLFKILQSDLRKIEPKPSFLVTI